MGEAIGNIWAIIKTYKAKLGFIIMALTTIVSTTYAVGISRGSNSEKIDTLDNRVTTIEKWVGDHSASDKATAVDAAKSITELQTKVAEIIRIQQEQSAKLDQIRDRLPPKP